MHRMQSEEGEILSEGEREEDTSMAEEEDAGVGDDLPSIADARRTAEQFMEATQKALNLSFRPRVVIPGDDCTTDVCSHSDRVRIGNGLIHGSQGAVRATKAGLLRHHAPNIYRVDNYQRRVSLPCLPWPVRVRLPRLVPHGHKSPTLLHVLTCAVHTKSSRLRAGSSRGSAG
jgi:hypothetical protein